MSVNREVGQTDDLRLGGLLTGGGSGGYMYNYGPSGAPSNQPPTAFEQGLTRGPVSMTGMSDAQMQSLIDQRLDARALDMNEDIDTPDQRGEPTELGTVESVSEMLQQIMEGGGQGNIAGLDPETVAAVFGTVDRAGAQDLSSVAQEIFEAGGFEQWLESQGDVVLGDPGGIEDTTQTSTEVIFDEEGNPVEIIIDPTLITLPPIIYGDFPQDEEGGGGASQGETQEQGEAGSSTAEGDEIFTSPEIFYEVLEDGTVIGAYDGEAIPEDRLPDWIRNMPAGYYPEHMETRDEDRQQPQSPSGDTGDGRVVVGLPGGGIFTGGGSAGGGDQQTGGSGGGTSTGAGTSGGAGAGSSDGSGTGNSQTAGMFDPKFKPYQSRVGYQPVAIPGLVLPDYAQSLNGLFKRLSK